MENTHVVLCELLKCVSAESANQRATEFVPVIMPEVKDFVFISRGFRYEESPLKAKV